MIGPLFNNWNQNTSDESLTPTERETFEVSSLTAEPGWTVSPSSRAWPAANVTTGLCGFCVERDEDATLRGTIRDNEGQWGTIREAVVEMKGLFVCFYFFSHQAPQVNTLAEFHSGSSALHSRATMVENIYEIDGEGEYQYLPRPTGDRLVVDETRGAFSRFTGS